MTAAEGIRLRPVEPGDLPRMCDLQLDPESNRMAVTIPRTAEAFAAHWAKVLDDPCISTLENRRPAPLSTSRKLSKDSEWHGIILYTTL